MTGFEPAATRPPDVYSTGLSYIPKWLSINAISKFDTLALPTPCQKSIKIEAFADAKVRKVD